MLNIIEIDRNNVAVFSNNNGSISILPTERLKVIEFFTTPRSLEEALREFPGEKEFLQLVIKRQLVVETSGGAELELLDKMIKDYKNRLAYTFWFTLTMNCNFACSYCYERLDPRLRMTQETALRCVDFLAQAIKDSSQKELSITFYGGEPLLEFSLMKIILSNVRSQLGETHVNPRLVTNGSLLNPDVVKFIAENQFELVQVTLDGPREVHDARRGYKSGKGSFDDIIDGLKLVRDQVKTLLLRVNVDRDNQSSIISLIAYLKSNGFVKRNVVLWFAPVYANTPACEDYQNKVLSPGEATKALAQLIKVAREEGFSSPVEFSRFLFCGAYNPKSMVFNHDGRITSCTFCGVGREFDFTIGNVYDEPVLHPRYEQNRRMLFGRSPLNLDACRACEIVAFCGGGCVYDAMRYNGKFNSVSCPHYRTGFEELARLHAEEIRIRDEYWT